MKDNVINEKNVKIPLYVTAYETISQWLKEGKYKAGDKLPGENILAEQLAVSRGTLRQAAQVAVFFQCLQLLLHIFYCIQDVEINECANVVNVLMCQ